MYPKVLDRNKGYYFAIAFAASNSLLCIKNILIQGSSFLYENNTSMNILVAVISVFLYLYAIIKENKPVLYRKQLLLIMFIVSIWVLTIIFRQDLFSYYNVRSELLEFVIYSVPAILFLPHLPNCDELLDAFYRFRWWMFIATCIAVLFMVRSGTIQDAGTRVSVYSMAFGRAVLLPTLLFLSKYFEKHTLIDLVCGCICALFIVLFGSRFPILCIICFILWGTLKKPLSFKKVLLIVAALSIAIFIIINLNDIVEILASFLSSKGINSRSLTLLLNGSFNYDSGRKIIMVNLIGKINESPIWGYGAGGGIIALNDVLPHSFVLDVFANIGYLCGGVFLLVAAFLIVKAIRTNNSKKTKEYFAICLCIFLPICFFQTSMWTANYFWIILALSCGRSVSMCEENNNEIIKDY